MAIVCRPPALGVGHEGVKILDYCVKIEGLELGRIVKVMAHGICQLGVLVQNGKVETVGPPMLVARDLARVMRDSAVHGRFGLGLGGRVFSVRYWTFHFGRHVRSFDSHCRGSHHSASRGNE
jgi:hypothetical protein